jgi:hypothetical protein
MSHILAIRTGYNAEVCLLDTERHCLSNIIVMETTLRDILLVTLYSCVFVDVG